MPILDLNTNQNQTPTNQSTTNTSNLDPNHGFKTQETLKTSTIFEKELPSTQIRYQVDGIPWTVDYFNQILNVNSTPQAPDINIPSTSLKYNRVDSLDIFVDTGLPTGVATDITGTGVINAGFVPYIGDAFTATIAGGRLAIFVLTSVRKEYYNTHDIYVVDFKLTYFLDTSADIYNDLVYKTVRTYVYDKEAIAKGQQPVLLAKDYKVRIDLRTQPVKIIKHYLDLFLDNRTKRLVLPTMTSTYIDQLATNMVFKLSSVSDVPELADVIGIDNNIKSPTIWDALLARDINVFNRANPSLRYVINTVDRNSSRRLHSYLGINYIITDNINTPILTPDVKPNPLAAKKTVPTPISNPDGSYIFSMDFYNQTPGVSFSNFETVLIEYIRGGIPNRVYVEQLLQEYMYWGYEEQYTLLPMLVFIVNALVNDTYSAL